MFLSKIVALAAILSSFAAANGAVLRRDGTFTYATPSTTASSYPPETPSVPVTPTTTASVHSKPSTPTETPTVTSSVPITKSTATGTPPPTSPSSAKPKPTGGTVNCDSVQNWQAAFAYTAGQQVIYNNQLYTAKQWTYNNAPPAHPDQWTLGGTCTQPINNQADCKGVQAWANNVAYTAGDKVTYKNSLWSAVQWTYANSPGDASGSWKDLGVCA